MQHETASRLPSSSPAAGNNFPLMLLPHVTQNRATILLPWTNWGKEDCINVQGLDNYHTVKIQMKLQRSKAKLLHWSSAEDVMLNLDPALEVESGDSRLTRLTSSLAPG